MKDPEAVAAALQLLLGDLPDEQKRALFYKAFPDNFILLPGDAKSMGAQLRNAETLLSHIIDMTDGATPLGRIAQQGINAEATSVRTAVRLARALTGL